MNDPYPVEPGTGGTVQFIDDAGSVGVEWDNGCPLSLSPECDSFNIQHLQNFGFYMPMTATMEQTNQWGDYLDEEPKRLSDREAVGYADIIRAAILRERAPEKAERGLMIYHSEQDSLNAKVHSLLRYLPTVL